jgi:FdhD protein
MPPSDEPAFKDVSATSFPYEGSSTALDRAVPVETPLNIVFSPVPYAVMMISPQDVDDFVTGFSRTEGIIETAQDIREMRVEAVEGGLRAEVSLASDKMQRHLARTRNLAGRTGCGVCGIADMAALPYAAPAGTARVSLALPAVHRALREMSSRQDLNRLTRAVHAAAWCRLDGEVAVLREDVGRHNALDKLIGALMRAGVDPASGFVAITSRCSFEMVEKAAAFGASALVAVSAPTSLAIQRAEQHDLLMLAVARDDGALCFTYPERITSGAEHGASGRRWA